MSYSLRHRLTWLATSVLFLGLGLTAWVLDTAYTKGLHASIEEKLQIHILSVLAAAEYQQQQLAISAELPDARFQQLSSGLYAIILDQNGEQVWRSASMVAWPMAETLEQRISPLLGGERDFVAQRLDPENLVFIAMLGTVWEDEASEFGFTVIVAEDATGFTLSSKKFRNTLWFLLISIGSSLLLVQLLLLRWGLKPLASVVNELQAIGRGQKNELTEQYPLELEQLTTHINRLLYSEQQQRQKYSHRMADLAHSLKTPLAILNAAAVDSEQTSNLGQQVSRMNNIVDYHLKRAVLGSEQVSIKKVAIEQLVTTIRAALDKVYLDKAIQCQVTIDPQLTLRADESDLTEIVANLMDNAYKYGVSQVSVSCAADAKYLRLTVEDDGAGLSAETFAQALTRGTRLDTQQSGQGIGLAMVNELVSQYQGEITCQPSPLLGAAITIIFPRHRL